MNLTPLKYILFIENVTSVFRNYLCFKRRTRIIVLVGVFIELFNISLTAVTNFAPEYKHQIHHIHEEVYFFMSTGFSIYLLIAPLYYSKRFYRLLLNFDAFYKYFDDGVYYRKMVKSQKVLNFIGVSFCCFIIFMYTIFRLPSSAGSMGWVVTIIALYCNSMSDTRYIVQYFVLYCILFVVSEQVKAITQSIDSELSAMRENCGDVEDLSSVGVNHNKLNKWIKAYESISDSSNLCNSMFSVQMTTMLLMVTVYYTMCMYTITIIVVGGAASWSLLLPNLLSMAVLFSTLFVISRAGQQIQNSYVELRQKLCELCVHTLENEKFYKPAKDLLRYVRTRPVRVHVFGTLEVNMSTLPSVVAFFTTYTVIALQFNNVV